MVKLFQTVVSEPIEGHEEYSMLALQLGPTEASRYWIYWVPNQENNTFINKNFDVWHFLLFVLKNTDACASSIKWPCIQWGRSG